jgi:hypothetical protein
MAVVLNGSGWMQQARLTASDAVPNANLGFSVGISGNTVMLGRNTSNFLGGFGPGAAYVFIRSGSTWSQQQKLPPPGGAVDDFFGFTAAVSGDTILVGAYQDDQAGLNAGAAYGFVRSSTSWSLQSKLTASGAAAEDDFGIAVSVSGDRAVVVPIWPTTTSMALTPALPTST